MHKLTVIYPDGDGVTFDMAYYQTTHKDLCFKSIDGLERMEIDRGADLRGCRLTAGGTPAVPYGRHGR